MLLALGAGSSVALTGSSAAASLQEEGDGEGEDGPGDGSGGGQGNRRCPPCIDAYSGYLQVEAVKGEQPLGSIDPVTTVELRVADADVAFPDGEGPAPAEPGTGTNETANATGNESVPGGAVNETQGEDAEIGGGGQGQGMPDFYFDPVGVHLQPGETIEFLTREELHTVTAFHPRFGFQQRVPDGAVGFTSPPFLAEDSWYYRFDEPGVYDLLCLPHYSLGMVMRVVVVDEGEQEIPDAAPMPGPDEPELALPEIEENVLTAPELEPENVVEEGPIAWTDLSDIASQPSPDV